MKENGEIIGRMGEDCILQVKVLLKKVFGKMERNLIQEKRLKNHQQEVNHRRNDVHLIKALNKNLYHLKAIIQIIEHMTNLRIRILSKG